MVVLDDLQWADGSTLSLLDLIARSPQPAALCVIGCYRPGELAEPAHAQLPLLATAVEQIELGGLDRKAVATMVAAIAAVPPEDLDKIHRRAGGHPVFTRELALVRAQGEPTIIPSAVRDTIELRARRLPELTRRSLEVAALSGNEFQVAVVATALGATTADVEAACRAAINGRVLTGTPEAPRFAHDLYRETIAASVDPARRPALHLAIGADLEARHLRGAAANPADVARHFTRQWASMAQLARRAGRSRGGYRYATFAFAEAAGQLRRATPWTTPVSAWRTMSAW